MSGADFVPSRPAGAPEDDDPALSAEMLQAAASRAATAAIGKLAGPDGSISLDPERVERDLARLVLALIEFLRQLLEAQAIRRMEKGALTPEQEERVGETLYRARARLVALAAEFGLAEEDLSLDLGPLGKLV